MEYDRICLEIFLKNQGKLYDEPVAETPEDAENFLEEMMAFVCSSEKEVVSYFRENLDASGMSDREILEADEVFALPDGRFLVVEG